MTQLISTIKLSRDADQSISVKNNGATGDIWLDIDGISVNIEFNASIETEYEPAEYDDGYLVYAEEWRVIDATVDSLIIRDAIDAYENPEHFELDDVIEPQIKEFIADLVLMTPDELDLEQARFDAEYDLASMGG